MLTREQFDALSAKCDAETKNISASEYLNTWLPAHRQEQKLLDEFVATIQTCVPQNPNDPRPR